MRRSGTRSVLTIQAIGILCVGLLLTTLSKPGAALADEPSVLQDDREFVQGAAKGNTAAVAKLLDTGFTWTDAEGKTFSRGDVLSSLPKPALGDETGAHQVRQTRSQVEAIMAERGNVHVLRLWVKRGSA